MNDTYHPNLNVGGNKSIDRANRAREALAPYVVAAGTSCEPLSSVLSDFLTDALHLAIAQGYEADSLLDDTARRVNNNLFEECDPAAHEGPEPLEEAVTPAYSPEELWKL